MKTDRSNQVGHGAHMLSCGRAVLLALMVFLLPACASAAWFNNSWTYRVPIIIPAGTSVNSTMKLDVDFAVLLTTLGAAGTFDANSPRVVRPNNALSTNQEFTDAVYAGATDAVGNSRGEVRFLLEDAGPATYYLYFDVTANGPKAINPQVPIDGNFEQSTTGTKTPPGWTINTADPAYDAQVRPSETLTVTTDTSGANLSSTTDGTPNTGNFSYLLGARTNVEPNTGATSLGVTLSRTFTVPATNPGKLTLRYRREGWDSSDDGATNFDFIEIELASATLTTLLVGPTANPPPNNYPILPFSPNLSTNQIGKKNSGYGLYNYWDMDTGGNHHAGMTVAPGAQPWWVVNASLANYAGQTITLNIRSFHTNLYKSWTHIDDVEWSVVSTTAGVPEKISSAQPGGFNAYDVATTAGAIVGNIQTKIAGATFSVDLIALNTARNAIFTTFTGPVKVELLDSSATGALDANGCNAAWPTIQTLAINPLFAAANNGRLTINAQENNAWRNVRFRVSSPATGTATAIGCSNDNFAIRPAAFTAPSATDTDWQSAGNGRVLASVVAAGGNVHRAGQPFTVIANAVNALAVPTVTTGYSGAIGVPTAVLSACGGAACPVLANLGVASIGGVTASAGVLTAANSTYSEAGSFNLQLQDTTFAAVDANDGTPATCAGQYICSPSAAVGRFVPDHFTETVAATPILKTTCSAGAFTYLGQRFAYATAPQVLITAQNVGGITTKNYAGVLWRTPVASAIYSSVPAILDTSLTFPPNATSNNNGTTNEVFSATVPTTDQLAYTRSLTTPLAPFNAAISLVVSVTDPSEAGVVGNGTITATSALNFNGSGSGIAFDAGTTFRYGRLKLGNAFGSEALDLPIPLEAQYWNGSLFVTNVQDTCTTLTAANFALGNYTKTLTAANTGTSHIVVGGAFVAGKGSLKLSKPSPGAIGSVDIALNLGIGAGTVEQFCAPWSGTAPTSNGADKTYLRGRWCLNNYDRDPRARITFGIYKNANEFIYLRETY